MLKVNVVHEYTVDNVQSGSYYSLLPEEINLWDISLSQNL